MTNDIRTLTRRAAAVILPAGPLVLALSVLVGPTAESDKLADVFKSTAANHGRYDVDSWLMVLSLFLLVPSILFAGRLARRGAPRLALWGVALAVPGYMALYAVPGSDLIARNAAASDHDAAMRVADALGHYAPLNVTLLIFIAGHTIGTVLLGVGLWRSGAVPAWAAWLVIVSQPIVTFGYAGGMLPVAGAAALLNAVGFAVAGRQVLRLTDDEWDVPAKA